MEMTLKSILGITFQSWKKEKMHFKFRVLVYYTNHAQEVKLG